MLLTELKRLAAQRTKGERLRNEPPDVAETRKALAEGEVLLENIKLRAENAKLLRVKEAILALKKNCSFTWGRDDGGKYYDEFEAAPQSPRRGGEVTPEDIKKAREIIAGANWGRSGSVGGDYLSASRTGWPEALDEVERLQNELNYWTHGGIVKSELEKLRAELEDAKDIITSRGVVIEELRAEIAELKAAINGDIVLYKAIMSDIRDAQDEDWIAEHQKLRAVAEAAKKAVQYILPESGEGLKVDHVAMFYLLDTLSALGEKK